MYLTATANDFFVGNFGLNFRYLTYNLIFVICIKQKGGALHSSVYKGGIQLALKIKSLKN